MKCSIPRGSRGILVFLSNGNFKIPGFFQGFSRVFKGNSYESMWIINLSTMAEENFEIFWSQMSKYHQFIHHSWRKFWSFLISNVQISAIYPPWLKEILKFSDLKCPNIINLSTMAGENFEIFWSQMSKYQQFIHHGWRKIWNFLISNVQISAKSMEIPFHEITFKGYFWIFQGVFKSDN